MTKFTPMILEACPVPLREAVEKERAFAERYGHSFSILSLTLRKSTTYYDKTEVVRTYRAFLNCANVIAILECDDGPEEKVRVDSLLWGDVMEILRHPPEGSGMEQIRQVVLSSDQAWQLN